MTTVDERLEIKGRGWLISLKPHTQLSVGDRIECGDKSWNVVALLRYGNLARTPTGACLLKGDGAPEVGSEVTIVEGAV